MLRDRILKRGAHILRMPDRAMRGAEKFTHLEASGSIVLLATTILAMVAANSALGESYLQLWETKAGLVVGEFAFKESLLHWINDALMALFFFVVGLEIKREVLVGELSSFRKAILPIGAALGGMLVPAAIYLVFNAGQPSARGWGVPMATDIAFALGVMSLLGDRVPLNLKVFLTALAIADDIGAVLVIALFYTAEIHWAWLGIGALCLLVLFYFNFIRIRSPLPFVLFAIGVWLAFFESGVHATIAGVLVALAIPTQSRRQTVEFVVWGRERLEEIEKLEVPGAHSLDNKEQARIAAALQKAARHIQSPLRRIEHALHPWTTFMVLPLFALANAGIVLAGNPVTESLFEPISLGIIFGLVFGKQLGITFFAFLCVRLKLSTLPRGVSWRQIYGASWLGGIGFTMSIFVSNLAFAGSPLVGQAKLAILLASLIAGLGGYLILRGANPPTAHAGVGN